MAETFLEVAAPACANEIFDWGQDYFQTPAVIRRSLLPRLLEGSPRTRRVIETEVPNCEYFNFVLQNFWVESLGLQPHEHLHNNHTAKLNDDGTMTIVVAAKDPGYGNWIDTDSHSEGTWALRWIKADSHPIPTSTVVKI